MTIRNWLSNLSGKNRAKAVRTRARRPVHFKTLVERLEDRLLPAPVVFANDNWSFLGDLDASNSVTTGDIVRNDNDTINTGLVLATYGVTGFGSVTSGAFTLAVSGTATLQDAINGVDAAGIVNVLEGDYNLSAPVNITKNLNLHGSNVGVNANAGTALNPGRVVEAVIHADQADIATPNASLMPSAGGLSYVINGFRFTGTAHPINDYQVNNAGSVQNNVFDGTDVMFFDTTGAAGLSFANNRLVNMVNVQGPTNVPAVQVGTQTPGQTSPVSFTGNVVADSAVLSGFNLSSVSGTVSNNHFSNLAIFGLLLANETAGITVSNNTFNAINDDAAISAGLSLRAPQNFTGTVTVTGNFFTGNTIGVRLRNATGFPVPDVTGEDIHINGNSFSGNVLANVVHPGTGTLDMSGNWWGVNTPAGVVATINHAGDTGDVDYTPWLDTGTDLGGDPLDGFQGDFSALHVDDDSPETGGDTEITEGIADLTAGGTLFVHSGSYTESVDVNKALTFNPGDSPGIVNITGDLTFSVVGSTLALEVNGTTPGVTGHDQINVSGAVDLNGADNVDDKVTLTVSSTAASNVGDLYDIITSGAGPVQGQFTNADNTIVSTGTVNTFFISYNPGINGVRLVSASGAAATTVYVDDDFAGFANGQFIQDADPVQAGDQNAYFNVNAFATIQAGIDAVAVGGTVKVNSHGPNAAPTGAYVESVSIAKALTLDGNAMSGLAADVVIDPGVGNGITVSGAAADNVTIRDLRVTGATEDGINASGVDNLTITNVQADGHIDDGIELANVAGTTSLTNVVAASNFGDGLVVNGAVTLSLSDLTITGNTAGGSINNVTTLNFTGTTGIVRDDITITAASLQHTRDPLGSNVVNQSLSLASVTNLNAFGDGGNDVFNINITGASAATSLNGGTEDDVFLFADGTSLNGGAIDGGAGIDTVNYTAYTSAVAVNLGANTPSLAATLDGDQEVPATPSSATGTASITYDNVAHNFDITLAVSGIAPALVSGFHLHRGRVGVNGPIIVDFGGNTNLVADGLGGFTFTANDVPLGPLHEAAFLGGITYINVHTPSFPGGEIRGQVFASALFVAAPDTASGTAGVTDVENAVGGSGSFSVGAAAFGDSIVGSNVANVLSGGPGNDVVVGSRNSSPTIDTMQGGAGDDILVWSNGDGNDVMDGGPDNDVVAVNGNPTAADVLVIDNGPSGRVDFDRTGAGAFSLDIGTVEALDVNGVGGDDSFTANDLTGVADLTAVNLNGFNGADTFNVTADASVAVTVRGHLPRANPGGDTLNYNGSGTVNPTGPGSGTVTASGVQPVAYAGIEAVNAVGGTLDVVVDANDDPAPGNQANDGVADTFRVVRSGANVQVFVNGALVFEGAVASVDVLTINGSGDNDTLLVDHAGGNPIPGGGITFSAAGETGVSGDSLQVLGGAFNTVTYAFTPDTPDGGPFTANGHNGSVSLDGSVINYTGLEPLTNTGTAADAIFTLPDDGLDNQAILEDDGDRNNGMVRLRSGNGTFETATFQNPSTSLTVNASDDGETITVATLDSAFAAAIDLNGNAGNDRFNITPSSTSTINADGAAPTGPGSAPGDILDVNTAGTTNPTLVVTSTNGDSKDGRYTFADRQPVTFTSIETLVAVSDLAITKTDSPDPVKVGGNITYTITLRNNGSTAALGVTLTDVVPANTTFVSFTAPAGFTPVTPPPGGTGTVTAVAPTFAAGAVTTFTLVVRVRAQAPLNQPVVNTVTVSSATPDSVAANNSATATTQIAHVSLIAVGAAPGGPPRVAVIGPNGAKLAAFLAFNVNSKGGVRVAVGDVNGDGVSDIIVAQGSGRQPFVKVVDGTKLAGLAPDSIVPNSALLAAFFAYQPGFKRGVFVAAGDVDGDGRDDIITGPGGGANARVKVIDAKRLNLVEPNGRISFAALHGHFLPYQPNFKGGVTVAAGDVDGDDRADVLTGPASGARPVKVVNGTRLNLTQPDGRIANAALLAAFFAYEPSFTGGVSLAADFVNSGNRADIITGPAFGQSPRVNVIDATKVNQVDANGQILPSAFLASQDVFEESFRGGVQVGAIDLDNDGLAEILAGFGPTRRRVLGLDMLQNTTQLTVDVNFNANSLGGNS